MTAPITVTTVVPFNFGLSLNLTHGLFSNQVKLSGCFQTKLLQDENQRHVRNSSYLRSYVHDLQTRQPYL